MFQISKEEIKHTFLGTRITLLLFFLPQDQENASNLLVPSSESALKLLSWVKKGLVKINRLLIEKSQTRTLYFIIVTRNY